LDNNLIQRQLLLFGHTRSNKILALYFALDGSIQEIGRLDLGDGLLRGIILVKEDLSTTSSRTQAAVKYQNKKIKLPMSPRILILDSNIDLHHFLYFDTRFSASAFSMVVRSVPLRKFIEREKFVWKKLIPHKKSRCKSLDLKTASSLENKKRNRGKSLPTEKLTKYGLWQDENRQISAEDNKENM